VDYNARFLSCTTDEKKFSSGQLVMKKKERDG